MSNRRILSGWIGGALALMLLCVSGVCSGQTAIGASDLAASALAEGEEWSDWEGWSDESEYDVPPPEEHIYSLERCIALTLQQNRAIEAANWEVEFYDAKSQEAWWAWWPRIRITGILTAAPDYDPPSMDNPEEWLKYEGTSWYRFDGPTVGGQVEMIAPLYTFGKIGTLKEMGKTGTKAAREGRKMLVGSIVREVKRAYYTLQFLEKMLNVLEEGRSYVESAERKLDELLADGSESVTEVDRYKFQVVKADVDMRIEEIRRNRDTIVRALRMLMNLSDDAPIYLAKRFLPDHEPVDSFASREFVHRTMLEHKPDLRFWDRQQELAELERRRQWSYYWPDFFLTLRYEYLTSPNMVDYQNPFLDTPYHRHYVAGFLGLSYTFDIPLQLARMRQADAQVNKTRHEGLARKDRLKLELDQAWAEYQEKVKQVEINEGGRVAGHKWMITAMMNYNIGLLESSGMIEALAAYFKTHFNYISAVYQAGLAQVYLEFVMGVLPLESTMAPGLGSSGDTQAPGADNPGFVSDETE